MRTKKKFPSYDIKAPKYPELLVLYDNLAFQDASFQANQIIIEFFDSHVTKKQLDVKEFIRELAKRHKISGGTEDFSRIKEMMAESYIVQTYNIAELFFKEFNKTFQKAHKIDNWKATTKIGKSDKKLDPLNQLAINLDSARKKQLQSLPEFLLSNYYRLLRNGYVHREIKKTVTLKKPCEYYDKRIVNVLDHFKKYYKSIPKSGILAPNKPNEITHRDFVLFSRASRNLANYLNELCALSVEQSFELAKGDSKFLNTPRNLNYNKFPHNKDKLELYLTHYYKTHFGISKDQIKEFIELFYNEFG
jgi:hypothetical protein